MSLARCKIGFQVLRLAHDSVLTRLQHALWPGGGADRGRGGEPRMRAQGSFAAGTFAAYVPALREAELCDVPGAEDDGD